SVDGGADDARQHGDRGGRQERHHRRRRDDAGLRSHAHDEAVRGGHERRGRHLLLRAPLRRPAARARGRQAALARQPCARPRPRGRAPDTRLHRLVHGWEDHRLHQCGPGAQGAPGGGGHLPRAVDHGGLDRPPPRPAGAPAMTTRGRVYVLGDNIDTDQIIPAEYLNLVPTIPEEYRKLGSYALAGLARTPDQPPFVPPGGMATPYTIIVAGKNFGCGPSREHAPIALGAAGTKAVVAESFARIFFRNCVATGELYPC